MTFPWAIIIVGIIGCLSWIVTTYIEASASAADADAIGFDHPEAPSADEDEDD